VTNPAVNDAIIVQSCGKIASEIVASVHHENIDDAMKSFSACFRGVLSAVRKEISSGSFSEPFSTSTTGGRRVPIHKSQDDIKYEIDNARTSTAVSVGQMASARTVKKGLTAEDVGLTF